MDSVLIDFLIDANPATATAILCAVVIFFYKIIKAHERYSKKILGEQNDLVNKGIDEATRMIDQIKDLSNDINNSVKELKMHIDAIDEKIKKIEEADFDNKVDLMYLKKDIESIRKCVEIHHLSALSFTPVRLEKRS